MSRRAQALRWRESLWDFEVQTSCKDHMISLHEREVVCDIVCPRSTTLCVYSPRCIDVVNRIRRGRSVKSFSGWSWLSSLDIMMATTKTEIQRSGTGSIPHLFDTLQAVSQVLCLNELLVDTNSGRSLIVCDYRVY
jgi:hypothetical protein